MCCQIRKVRAYRVLAVWMLFGLSQSGFLLMAAEDTPSVVQVPEVVSDSDSEPFQRLVSAQNDYFVVVAESMDDARPMVRLADGLPDLIRSWLVTDYVPSQQIVVQLIPPQLYSGTESYYLTADGRGGFIVSFRWNSELSLETACEGLARAFLASLLWQHDPGADPAQIPDWLVFGLSTGLEVSWASGRRNALYAEAQRDPALELEDILQATGPYGDRRDWVARESYLLLQFLQAELRDVSRQMWARVLKGEPFPWNQLTQWIEFLPDANARRLWWMVGRTDLLKSRVGPVLSLSESRQICIRLAYVTIEERKGDQRLAGEALIEHVSEDRDQLQRTYQDRIRMIKLILPRINPIYYNVMVSLGQFFEQLDAGNAEAATEAYLRFADDFAAAERLHQSAEALLYAD